MQKSPIPFGTQCAECSWDALCICLSRSELAGCLSHSAQQCILFNGALFTWILYLFPVACTLQCPTVLRGHWLDNTLPDEENSISSWHHYSFSGIF